MQLKKCTTCKEQFLQEELTLLGKTVRLCEKCLREREEKEANKLLTCSYCKKKFPKAELIQIYKTKKACTKCSETTVVENKERDELIAYICKGLGQAQPTGIQLNDIRRFKEMGFTYSGIKWTIYYMVSVIGKKIEPNGGLGLIPFYYHKAKEHYEAVEKSKQSVEAVLEQPKTITIVRGNDTRKPYVHKTRYVNIEEL